MDKALALAPLCGPNNSDTAHVYTHVHPLWCPPWGRGLFGGCFIGQSLCAAQNTVRSHFHPHSMHCYFLRPGAASDPVVYHVDTLLDGKRFANRSVHARQNGREIFCAMISFTSHKPPQQSRSDKTIRELAHATPIPAAIPPPPQMSTGNFKAGTGRLSKAAPTGPDRAYECIRCRPAPSGPPEQRKVRHWIRATVSPSSSSSPRLCPQEHLAALAYMSDGYFIGTVARVHGTRRFADAEYIDRMVKDFEGTVEEKALRREEFKELAREEQADNEDIPVGNVGMRVGMMATLHHAIFFHQWRGFEPEQWMLVEMDSPWAGEQRGLVTQRIWSQAGELLATCIQEGVVRLESVVGEGPRL